MGWMDSIKGKVSGYADKMKSGDTRTATLAIMAGVAGADGEIEPAEQTRITNYVTTSDLFSASPKAEVKATLDDFFGKATDDMVRHDLFVPIRKLKGKPDQARSAISVGISIAKADGEFEPEEKAFLVLACKNMDLDPAEFGLVA